MKRYKRRQQVRLEYLGDIFVIKAHINRVIELNVLSLLTCFLCSSCNIWALRGSVPGGVTHAVNEGVTVKKFIGSTNGVDYTTLHFFW